MTLFQKAAAGILFFMSSLVGGVFGHINISHTAEITPPTAGAQTDALFTPLPVNFLADATTAEARHLRTLQESPTTGFLQLVRVNLNELQGTTTVISLPSVGSMVVRHIKTFERSASDFTWIGELQMTGDQVIFVLQNGNMTGFIRSGLDLYSVTPLGRGIHALIKINQPKFQPD